MTIKINTTLAPVKLPFEIGSVVYEADLSDQGIEKIQELLLSVAEDETLQNVEEITSYSEGAEIASQVFKLFFDGVFGEGSYDRIYEEFPSIMTITSIFEQVAKHLSTEIEAKLEKPGTNAKVQSILENKKKKKKKKKK